MITWFHQLKIQGKLFGIFGFIVVVGALTVGTGLFNIIYMEVEADSLFLQAQKLDDVYQAVTFMQKMDLAEKSYVLSGDHRYLDNYRKYGARIDEFLRRALLDADTVEEKTALHELEHAKQAYEQNFAKVVAACNEGNAGEALRLLEASDEAIGYMVPQIQTTINVGRTLLDREAQWAENRALISSIIGVLTLVFFSALAIVAAVVITNQLNQPIVLLTDATAAVEESQFKSELLEDLVARTDEMGQLARAFIDMADEVHKREENLKQQADELRLKIEQQTRKKTDWV